MATGHTAAIAKLFSEAIAKGGVEYGMPLPGAPKLHSLLREVRISGRYFGVGVLAWEGVDLMAVPAGNGTRPDRGCETRWIADYGRETVDYSAFNHSSAQCAGMPGYTLGKFETAGTIRPWLCNAWAHAGGCGGTWSVCTQRILGWSMAAYAQVIAAPASPVTARCGMPTTRRESFLVYLLVHLASPAYASLFPSSASLRSFPLPSLRPEQCALPPDSDLDPVCSFAIPGVA